MQIPILFHDVLVHGTFHTKRKHHLSVCLSIYRSISCNLHLCQPQPQSINDQIPSPTEYPSVNSVYAALAMTSNLQQRSLLIQEKETALKLFQWIQEHLSSQVSSALMSKLQSDLQLIYP